MHTVHRHRGFTLIETMACLALISLLIGLGLPSFKHLLRMTQVQTVMADITADFASARIRAISRGTPVVVCPADALRCVNDGDWTRGWMLFQDADRNQRPDTDSDVFRMHAPAAHGLRIVSSRGRPQLRYLPDGMSGGSNLTISICSGETLAGKLIVNNAGRVRSERADGSSSCPP